jgi:hypothetical protein
MSIMQEGWPVSDFNDEEAKEQGRARARSTAVWDGRLCEKES